MFVSLGSNKIAVIAKASTSQDEIVKRYIADNWQIDVPSNWQHQEEEDRIMFYDPVSNGALVISSFREDEPINDDYLEDMLEDHLDADAQLYDENCGDFSGVSCCYDDEQEYWCEWYVFTENVMLFVTYNCPLEHAGEEDDVIDSMLESLTLITKTEPVLH